MRSARFTSDILNNVDDCEHAVRYIHSYCDSDWHQQDDGRDSSTKYRFVELEILGTEINDW